MDNFVVPIVLYGCNVQGCGDLNCLEKIHNDFLKHIQNVKQRTQHCMLQGDLKPSLARYTFKEINTGFLYKLINNDYNLSPMGFRIVVHDSYVSNNDNS